MVTLYASKILFIPKHFSAVSCDKRKNQPVLRQVNSILHLFMANSIISMQLKSTALPKATPHCHYDLALAPLNIVIRKCQAEKVEIKWLLQRKFIIKVLENT